MIQSPSDSPLSRPPAGAGQPGPPLPGGAAAAAPGEVRPDVRHEVQPVAQQAPEAAQEDHQRRAQRAEPKESPALPPPPPQPPPPSSPSPPPQQLLQLQLHRCLHLLLLSLRPPARPQSQRGAAEAQRTFPRRRGYVGVCSRAALD